QHQRDAGERRARDRKAAVRRRRDRHRTEHAALHARSLTPESTVASVVEIWRYPVKSMAGESLDSCEVTELGREGHRRWSFIEGMEPRVGKFFNIEQCSVMRRYRARLYDRNLN